MLHNLAVIAPGFSVLDDQLYRALAWPAGLDVIDDGPVRADATAMRSASIVASSRAWVIGSASLFSPHVRGSSSPMSRRVC
jgi:hypothetical protein